MNRSEYQTHITVYPQTHQHSLTLWLWKTVGQLLVRCPSVPSVQRSLLLSIVLLAAPSLANAQSISIGPFGPGINTGSEPFNTTGVCTAPGDDCSSTDTRIRSNDLQAHLYSLVISGIPTGDPAISDVVFEQTITPSAGAIVEFDDIPPVCLAPPAGSGGTNPLSSITQNADGSTTLLCNVGTMGNGDQKSFALGLIPSSESVNGSTFTTTVNAYGLDADGNVVIADTAYNDGNIYEISVAPTWDLMADRLRIYNVAVSVSNLGTGRGWEQGYLIYGTVHLASDASRGGKGVSALTDNFSFDFDVTAVDSDGAPYPLETNMIHCFTNNVNWAETVLGSETVVPTRPLEQKVIDSGTCTWAGDPVNGFTMNIADADTSGSRYPTQLANGTSLLDGPYFAVSHRVSFFVPFAEIEREDPIANSGSIDVTLCLNNFDPVDGKNNSNYGTGVEPGHNGTAMPDGGVSNSCSGPVTVELQLSGDFNYRTISRYNAAHQWGHDPYGTVYHAGDGIVEPSIAYAYFHFLRNRGSVAWNNPMQCSVFDNSTQKLTDRSNIGHTEGDYAFVRYLGGAVEADWQIEYASVDLSNVDPLDRDQDGTLDFDSAIGRYEGTWSDFENFRCDTPGVVWNTDPDAIGIDNVNAVRVVPKDPSVTRYDGGENLWLIVPVEARSDFYEGPYAGTPIPAGTVLASHGNYRSDEFDPAGVTATYLPSPENTSGRGDRMTLSRAILGVEKSTFEPLAANGVSQQILAGNDVIWQLQPTVTSFLASGGGAATAVELVDVLPSELSYEHGCTIANGSVPTSVLYNTPLQGQTTLKWSLGTLSSFDTIDPIRFCTTTNPTTPDGTQVTNTAYLDASNAIRSRISSQSIVLGQAGAMGALAKVDVPVDLLDDAQIHTLVWSNFSVNAGIQKPVMVNVLPHAGDDANLSTRTPGSAFSGTLSLTGPATDSWNDGSVPAGSDPFASIGTIYYSADVPATINHNPDDNTSDWCEWTGSSFIAETPGMNCPANFADVTAIKHVSNYDMAKSPDPRQAIKLSYTLQAQGNATNDQYVNVFGVDSVDLPAAQFVRANRSIVQIASFSIGDLVFVDTNSNGAYDAGVDQLMPDGLDVELYDANSNTLLASTMTLDGTFLFDRLSAGDFYVRIPGSWFNASGVLSDWNVSPNGAASNDDENHDKDHNGTVVGSITTAGIVTDVITLSSTEPAAGAAPTGDEPVGDNTVPIVDALTNDSFSNLTIDIGLLSGDADNDGIADWKEFGSNDLLNLADTDGDGTLNFRDSDADGDGIPDAIETSADSDLDGVPNYLDLDADNDGVPDANETQIDTDLDGIPDFLDTDSDNDGLTDTEEAGGLDANGDGRVDGFNDANGDGLDDSTAANPLPNPNVGVDGSDQASVDSDGDGIPDIIEGTADSDGDSVSDYLDTDSDNDGILDNVEVGTSGIDTDGDGIDDYYDVDITAGTDSNNDGLDDAIVANGALDSDNDGVPNYLDIDSDADGIADIVEGGLDIDVDGLGNYIDIDSDNDGISDSLETLSVPELLGTDTDNDGIDDALDVDITDGNDVNSDGVDDALMPEDFDADGFANYIDIDSDNDTLSDTLEAGASTALPTDTDGDGNLNYLDTDSDNDGIPDSVEGDADTDGDGILNYVETDSDGDTLPDAFEGVVDSDGDGMPDYIDLDSDGDTQLDIDESPVIGTDSDGDGIPNYLDLDSDNDGIPDEIEAQSSNGLSSSTSTDADGDGIDDAIEAGPNPASPIDTDEDGIADFLDPDSDNDGITDVIETGFDSDAGGISNNLDLDADNDGIPDIVEGTVDTDNDGSPNYLDLDSDDDGIPDSLEGVFDSGNVIDTDGVVNANDLRDTDGDGMLDFLDIDSDNDGILDADEASRPGLDSDSDGVDDYLDLDSDNDGILDEDEGLAGLFNDGILNDGVFDPTLNADTDGDKIPDSVEGDVDSDDDGVADSKDGDSDNDGIFDFVERAGDFDNDGVPNYLDIDSDNDGINDILEVGGEDMDNNGIIDSFIDNDGDGIDDSIAVLPFQELDADGDGIVDRFDVDDNNDGVSNMTGATDEAFADDPNSAISPVNSAPVSSAAIPVQSTGTSSDLNAGTSAGDTAASNANINNAFADSASTTSDTADLALLAQSVLPQESESPTASPATGIGSSSGCSVLTQSKSGSFDPTLAGLISVSMFAMLWHSRRRRLVAG